MYDYEYFGTRRIKYGDSATFIPVCKKCGRFVKADNFINMNGMDQFERVPNATCKKCGRIEMIFEGYI